MKSAEERVEAKRAEADKIFARKDLTKDQKLYLIYILYESELNYMFPELCYLLLEWANTHMEKIWCKEVVDILEEMKEV